MRRGSWGFFLKGLLCLQGRDASDQHIVDVVLKMLQGEGGASYAPSQPLSGHHLQESLQVALSQYLESWVLITALPRRNWEP